MEKKWKKLYNIIKKQTYNVEKAKKNYFKINKLP